MTGCLRKAIFSFAALTLLATICISTGAQDKNSEIKKDLLLSAMQAELKRAQKDLRLPDQPAPYFIEYWIQDSVNVSLTGKYGGITYARTQLQPSRYAGV